MTARKYGERVTELCEIRAELWNVAGDLDDIVLGYVKATPSERREAKQLVKKLNTMYDRVTRALMKTSQ